MFDFILIAGNNLSFKPNNYIKSYNQYLQDIDYIKKLYKKDKYEILTFTYPDNNKYFYHGEKADIYLMGKSYTNKKYAVEFNTDISEIYTEDICGLYEKKGKYFIDYIKGIFVLLIYDKINNKFFIYNDRTGLFNLYYYIFGNAVLISSNAEAILKYPGVIPKPDEISVIEYSVFDYPLGNNNIFRTLNKITGGTFLEYDYDNYCVSEYHNYAETINKQNDLNWDDTYEVSTKIFNSIIDCYIDNEKKIIASLTSGFDSRTNLSRLINTDKDCLYYSWGLPDSNEIKIPRIISGKYKINYKPIYLTDEYEEKIDYYAKQAVIWSGGTGTVRRANHTYGYSKLFNHSRFNLTGLFGSEIIRPANSVGHIFNGNFINILYSDDISSDVKNLLESESQLGFLKKEFIEKNKNGFIERVVNYFSELRETDERFKQLYFFTLSEGFSKYFGHELTGCRQYLHISSPYIDDDFLEFIFRTPIPQLNKYAFKRNFDTLKKGQLFYLPVIKNNCPGLLKIKTGRNYSPEQLISIFYPVNIAPGYLMKELRRKVKNDTFDNKKWNNIIFKKNNNILEYEDEMFNEMKTLADIIPDNYENTIDSNYSLYLSKQFSLRFWINEMIN